MGARLAIACGMLACAGNLTVFGQRPATFEVASVRANRGGSTAEVIEVRPGGPVRITNVPLRRIVQVAYNVSADQLVGGPSWLASERFDITAKTATPANAQQLRDMLQQLLRERFRLVTHVTEAAGPAFELVLARKDGKLGPGLRAAKADCDSLTETARVTRPTDSNPCGLVVAIGALAARGVSMDRLAGNLSAPAGGRVLNRTGLEGAFDFDLKFTPQAFLDNPSFDRTRFPQVDPEGPSLNLAVQEQLGLNLRPTVGPRTIVAIDEVGTLEAN